MVKTFKLKLNFARKQVHYFLRYKTKTKRIDALRSVSRKFERRFGIKTSFFSQFYKHSNQLVPADGLKL